MNRMRPSDLVPGEELALEFAQSETIRRAVVIARSAGPLGNGTSFDVRMPEDGLHRIFVYDKDIEVIGAGLMGVWSMHRGM